MWCVHQLWKYSLLSSRALFLCKCNFFLAFSEELKEVSDVRQCIIDKIFWCLLFARTQRTKPVEKDRCRFIILLLPPIFSSDPPILIIPCVNNEENEGFLPSPDALFFPIEKIRWYMRRLTRIFIITDPLANKRWMWYVNIWRIQPYTTIECANNRETIF